MLRSEFVGSGLDGVEVSLVPGPTACKEDSVLDAKGAQRVATLEKLGG
jgi:hypothetical protein